MTSGRGPREALFIWALLVTAFMLFPFRYEYQGPKTVENGVQRLEAGGLAFEGPSRFRSTAPPAWLGPAIDAEELDIVLDVQSASPDQRGPARILTVSDGRLRRNFMVAQKGVDLLVRARRPGADTNGAAPLKVDGVFAEAAPRTIEVRFRKLLIEVLVDGQPRYRETLESTPFELWSRSFTYALADEVDGARGWNGRITRAVATVGDSAYDLTAKTGIESPPEFLHIPEQTRRLWRMDTAYIVFVETVHLFVFLPFGFLLWLKRRSDRRTTGYVVRIALWAAFIGLVFQLAKVAFPDRHPSLLHVVFNSFGAACGAVAAAAYLRRRTQAS